MHTAAEQSETTKVANHDDERQRKEVPIVRAISVKKNQKEPSDSPQ
jgi:hypothetical protein